MISAALQICEFFSEALLPRKLSSFVLPLRDHWPPHSDTAFDGYYLRLLLSDASSAICIFSTVKNGNKLPNYCHFSLHPSNGSRLTRIESHVFPSSVCYSLGKTAQNGVQDWSAQFGDVASITFSESRQTLDLNIDSTQIKIQLHDRIQLDSDDALKSPHGPLARLTAFLPLHWGIYTPWSRASILICQGGATESMHGVGHFEKNWGQAFPSGWIWSQAMRIQDATSFALAGGHILGQKAFMLTVRTASRVWTFKPPWAACLFGVVSIGLVEAYDATKGTLDISLWNWSQKVDLHVKAGQPVHEWQGLYAPMADGHDHLCAWETFSATSHIVMSERLHPWSPWRQVEDVVFENSCLEFGGSYFESTT